MRTSHKIGIAGVVATIIAAIIAGVFSLVAAFIQEKGIFPSTFLKTPSHSSNVKKQDSINSNQNQSKTNQKQSETISEGDYVRFGTYDGAIVWKCISKDSNGTLLIASHILCQKPFDAAESGKTSLAILGDDVSVAGSNKWSNSNLREWLNSDENRVKFTTQAPTAKAVYANPYVDEPGFLSGFSQSEKDKLNKIKHTTVEDSVFILSKDELAIFSKKNTIDEGGDFWTRSQGKDPGGTVTSRDLSDSSYGEFCVYTYGVLPALYLNTEKYSSGKGSKEDPYMVQ